MSELHSTEVHPLHKRPHWLSIAIAIPGSAVAVATFMSIVWKLFLISPMVAQVKIAVAGDLRDDVSAAVQAQVAPLVAKQNATNAGLKASIQSAISLLEDDIAALEYRQRRNPESWTADDDQRLVNKKRRLREQRMALDVIEVAEQTLLGSASPR